MKYKSNRGALQFGLDWLIQLVLFGIILVASTHVTNEILQGGPELATSYAMTLGRKIETTAYTADNVTITASCPSDANFSIKGNHIRVGLPNINSSESGEYYYFTETEVEPHPKVNIDCSEHSQILIERKVWYEQDPDIMNNINVSLEVRGIE